MTRAPSRTLVEWLSQPNVDSAWPDCDIARYQAQHRTATTEQLTQGYFEALQQQLRQGDVSAITINTALVPRQQTIGHTGLRRSVARVTLHTDAHLTLQNLRIGELLAHSGNASLSFVNCDIGRLYIAGNTGTDVRARDLNIGVLEIAGYSLAHFEMTAGCILDLKCTPPGGDNPFTGTVLFHKVFFPRDRKNYLLKGPQPYRNLRHHLRSLENAQMANLIHSAELAVERQDDEWPNRLIGWFYQLFSDFGSSALRPLLWLVGFAGVSFVWTYKSAGAVLASAEKLEGWQKIFLRTDCAGELLRSLYLAFQPVANPIGIFAKEPLLLARFPSLAVWLSIQGVLSVILIALAIFAIRRRFKIS